MMIITNILLLIIIGLMVVIGKDIAKVIDAIEWAVNQLSLEIKNASNPGWNK